MIKLKHVHGVAAILVHEKKIAAFKRNHGDYAGYYELVGGKTDKHETNEMALHRECLEELNITITIHNFFKEIRYDYKDFVLTLDTYVCTPHSLNFQLIVHDDVCWVDHTSIDSLNWLPADIQILDDLKQFCVSLT